MTFWRGLTAGLINISEVFHRLRKGKPRIESTCPNYGVHYRPGCLLTFIFGEINFEIILINISFCQYVII